MSEKSETKFAMALDPIHVGTGGYSLGRVDNTIVREPGTKVPKIPGSTINGAARTYSYYYLKENREEVPEPACALGKELDNEPPCGEDECPLCSNYGFAKKEESKKSKVNFTDARIVLFPVHSMKGPIWITSPSVLKALDNETGLDNEELDDKIIASSDLGIDHINLGWLYLEIERTSSDIIPDHIPKEIKSDIKDRIVLVSDKVFSQVINSNLENRTSVSIDPETGAAQEGALFTYEAIPRGTVFWFEINLESTYEKIPEIVKKGLKKFETLGVGGMTSRGLGRLWIPNMCSNGEGTDER